MARSLRLGRASVGLLIIAGLSILWYMTLSGHDGGSHLIDDEAAHSPPSGHSSAASSSVTAALGAENIVLTAFVATAQPFYHGRDVPSLDWVGAFILSLFAVAPQDSSSTILVFFVDNVTLGHLRRWGTGRLRNLEARRVLNFVVVRFPRSKANGRCSDEGDQASNGMVEDEEVCPEYLAEPWASNVNNAANSYRFALYRDWIAAWRDVHLRRGDGEGDVWATMLRTKVLISDNTDVLFQRDPFKTQSCFPPHWDNAPTVVFTGETKTFRNEKYNRRWFSCYGQQILDRVAQRRSVVSCAGVTLGNAVGIMRYAAAQVRQLRRPDLVECSGRVIHAALDQATHNFLLHRQIAESWLSADSISAAATHDLKLNLPEDAADALPERRPSSRVPGEFVRFIVGERDACVFHGNFGSLRLSTNSNTRIPVAVNAHDEVYALVHQYTSNRHPAVMKAVRERFTL